MRKKSFKVYILASYINEVVLLMLVKKDKLVEVEPLPYFLVVS